MKQDENQVGTIVGSSVHLTGAIKDSSDITIFGSVEGEVSSEDRVIVEESANVKGPITAREVIVSGYVNGMVTARDRVEVNTSGTLKGNIDTKDLLIHSGACFIGESSMPEKNSEGSFAVEEEVQSEPEVEAETEDSVLALDENDEDSEDK